MGLLYFVVLLGVIVFIHELGHFLVAKMFHVYVGEFALGMGPKLLSYQGKETLYSLRAIPLGGFCQMAGEVGNELEGELEVEVEPERSLKGTAKWKQILIMVAGIFMNFLLAWVIFTGIFVTQGYTVTVDLPKIGSIIENSPAERVGLMPGDEIVQIEFADGTIVVPETFSDMSASALANLTASRIYTVERDGKMMTFEVTPEYMEDQGIYLVGFSAPVEHVQVGLLQGMADGVSQMAYVTVMMVESILDLFKGQNLDQISGPVGIYTVTAEQASLGLTNYIWLIAIISLNVGIVNAIPLPVLDGGRVVLTVFEMITGKPINKNIEQSLMTIAIVLLLGLMLFATGQDILRLFK